MNKKKIVKKVMAKLDENFLDMVKIKKPSKEEAKNILKNYSRKEVEEALKLMPLFKNKLKLGSSAEDVEKLVRAIVIGTCLVALMAGYSSEGKDEEALDLYDKIVTNK